MPRRAAREASLLEQQNVRDADARQVIRDGKRPRYRHRR
jgi:hypothetical protein